MKLYIFDHDGSGLDYREATPDEIKSAHPKCGECRHIEQRLAIGTGFTWKECGNVNSTCHAIEVYPTTDYCNKWEAK